MVRMHRGARALSVVRYGVARRPAHFDVDVEEIRRTREDTRDEQLANGARLGRERPGHRARALDVRSLGARRERAPARISKPDARVRVDRDELFVLVERDRSEVVRAIVGAEEPEEAEIEIVRAVSRGEDAAPRLVALREARERIGVHEIARDEKRELRVFAEWQDVDAQAQDHVPEAIVAELGLVSSVVEQEAEAPVRREEPTGHWTYRRAPFDVERARIESRDRAHVVARLRGGSDAVREFAEEHAVEDVNLTDQLDDVDEADLTREAQPLVDEEALSEGPRLACRVVGERCERDVRERGRAEPVVADDASTNGEPVAGVFCARRGRSLLARRLSASARPIRGANRR